MLFSPLKYALFAPLKYALFSPLKLCFKGSIDSDPEVVKAVNMCHFLMIAVVCDASKEKLI